MYNKLMLNALQERVTNIDMPMQIVCWNGWQWKNTDSPRLRMFIKHPTALLALVNPKLGRLAETYIKDAIDFEGQIADIIKLGDQLCKSQEVKHYKLSLSALVAQCLKKLPSAQSAIAQHYDVSNDFYALWLDRSKVYSCAYFKQADDTLDQAQEQKLEHICRKLMLKPHDRFLDIGCGWGGLLFWAAEKYQARCVGVTLSQNQYDYVSQQIEQRGLQDRVQVRFQHYQDLSDKEQYDKIASIGMFEHVGLKNLPAYFSKLYQLLRPGGLILNHGITAGTPQNTRGLGGEISEFIDKYVFPGGQLIHLCRVIEMASNSGLDSTDVECWRKHYAQTLDHWVHRLDAHRNEAINLVGQERYRIWRIYMAGSANAFKHGWISIYQVLATKPLIDGSTEQPLTREHQYA
jgi:cyclopropane-fatty-acyl-phospholipid synthase